MALVSLLGATAILELLRWRKRVLHGSQTALRESKSGYQALLEKHQTLADQHRALLEQHRRVHAKLALTTRDGDEDRSWRALRGALASASTPARQRLFVFPMSGVNDYLKLIYQEFPDCGFDVIPLENDRGIDSLEPGDTLQIHWTKRVQAGCKSQSDADQATDAWLERMVTLRDRGVHLIWSVHEAQPHECRFPATELRLRQGLCEIVDIVHVLHEATRQIVDDAFEIPVEKQLVSPHPTYTGSLPDHLNREALRRDLGFDDDDALLLALGSIRPYKGYERVIMLIPRLQDRLPGKRIRLLIAGPIQHDPSVLDYLRALEDHIAALDDPETVILHPGAVPRYHLHALLKLADVSVAPYNAGLNSGVLMMNMSFGVPTVITANPVIDDIASHGPVATCPPGDDDALLAAIDHSLTTSSLPVNPQFLADHAPARVSREFATELRRRLSMPSP